MIPSTSHPEFRASIVAAEMTEFIPGAGPPPHKIPSLIPPSFQQRRDSDRRALAESLGSRSGTGVPFNPGPHVPGYEPLRDSYWGKSRSGIV
jgi:hypothetical protein